jgi:toxin ParE1/3/4
VGYYRLSPRAKLDLDEISDKIAPDNPLRAVTFVDELVAKFEKIGDHPHGYARRPDLPTHCRVAVHGNYRVIYKVETEVPVILRVFHGARNTHGIEL